MTALLELSSDHMMEHPDSPTTLALIQATIEAESEREKAAQVNSWQASVDEMILIPEVSEKITPLPLEQLPFAGDIHPKINRPKKDRVQGNEQPYNNHRNPVRTVPPPNAITVNSAPLKERIDNLQKLALVGRWHFPEMSEEVTRKWLADKWIPAIGYVPVISRLMKDWYSFHFQKTSDMEFIITRPWVSGRSFLALSRW